MSSQRPENNDPRGARPADEIPSTSNKPRRDTGHIPGREQEVLPTPGSEIPLSDTYISSSKIGSGTSGTAKVPPQLPGSLNSPSGTPPVRNGGTPQAPPASGRSFSSSSQTFTGSPAHSPSPPAPGAQGPGVPGPVLNASGEIEPPGYQILGELGRGGMGVVYKARQKALNRVVALKMILHAGHAGTEARERFRIEAQAVAALQHPNVVQVFEVGEHHSQGASLPFFSLEFCNGGSLAERLKGTPLPVREAARLILVLARAMQHAHQHGVIHRDLKPANILYASDATPKITDFGLAKRLDEDSHTQSGSILGTPSYMAPEQAAGITHAIGPGTDIYALGSILYELLTGRPPFRAPTVWDTLYQVMRDEPVPPSRLQSKIPTDLETICLKCLQKEPRRRYQTMAGLAADCEAFLEGRPITARPVGVVTRTIKWVRRRPTLAALLLVLILGTLGAIAAGGWFTLQLRKERDIAQQKRSEAEQARQEAMDSYQAAEANRIRAEKQQRLAEANEREAKRNLVKARENFRLAEDRFRKALETVNIYFTEVGENTLLDEPGMEPLRLKLLSLAQGFYQNFVKERQDDPSLRGELGQALLRLARISRYLDKADKALEHLDQALGIHKELVNKDASFRAPLAQTHHERGRVLRLQGKLEKAITAYEEAIRLWKVLKAEGNHPDHLEGARLTLNPPLEILHGLAQSLIGLGNTHMLRWDYPQALQVYDEALQLRRQLVQKDQQKDSRSARNETNRRYLALALNNLANARNQARGGRGQESKVLGAYLEAKKLQEELVKERPDRALFRDDLAMTLYNVGNFYSSEQNWSEAVKWYQQAIEQWKHLNNHRPAVTFYQARLAEAYGNLALVYRKWGKPDLARPYEDQALKLKEKLAREKGNELPEYRAGLARLYASRGHGCLQEGKVRDALDWYKKARTLLVDLTRKHPQTHLYTRELARTLYNMGEAQLVAENESQALKCFRDSLQQWESLGSLGNQVERAWWTCLCTNALGQIALRKGELDTARKWFSRGREVLGRSGSGSVSSNVRLALYQAHRGIAEVLDQEGEFVKAREEWQKAGKLAAKSWQGWHNLSQLPVELIFSRAEALETARKMEPRYEKLQLADGLYILARVQARAAQTASNPAEKKKHEARALELLKKAAKLQGYFQRKANLEKLKNDQVMKSLRESSPEMRAWERTLSR